MFKKLSIRLNKLLKWFTFQKVGKTTVKVKGKKNTASLEKDSSLTVTVQKLFNKVIKFSKHRPNSKVKDTR